MAFFHAECAVGLKKASGGNGQFAQSSSGKSLFSFWLQQPMYGTRILVPSNIEYRGTWSPVTLRETRPCHGQLRYLSKCASVWKSMVIFQLTATSRPNFNSRFAIPSRTLASCGRSFLWKAVLGKALERQTKRDEAFHARALAAQHRRPSKRGSVGVVRPGPSITGLRRSSMPSLV
jgi:hypothetical protein